MPYFIHIESRIVTVTPPGRAMGTDYVEVPSEVAVRYSLAHGSVLTAEQLADLQSQSGAPWAAPAASSATPYLSPSTSSHSAVPSARDVARAAEQIALFVEVLAWVLGAASVIVGLLLAARQQEPDNGLFLETSHPYIGVGVGLAVGGLFQSLFVVMIAKYIRARMMFTRQQ